MADPSPTLPATIRWPSETTRPAEHFAQVYRGEAIRISCVLTEYAKPIDLTGATVSFYWQPIGADDPTAWWEAPNGAASASGNAVSIVFNAATMDDGHGAYRAFFRIVTQGGATYRANGVLGMLESPGATPNEIPFPPRILDFATVQVLNAPYWTKAEADARFATPAAATLNGRGYGPWTADPASIEYPPDSGETVTFNTPELGEYETSEGTAYGWYWHNPDGVYIGLDSADPNATEFRASWEYADITFSRSALPGYVLGNQTDKPVAALGDIPAASDADPDAPGTASPGTSASYARSDHVHPKDTTKADLENGTVPLLQLPTYPASKVYVLSAETPLDQLIPSDVGINDKLVSFTGAAVAANRLPVASPTVSAGAFALDPATAVYRVAAIISGTAATIPTPDATAIPEAAAYCRFEMEVAVDATATSLAGPTGWTWLDGGELPTTASDYAGKTLYIAARLDCAQGVRTFVANVWRIA